MMTGFLSSQGSEKRVGDSLQRVNPAYHTARQVGAERQLNPVPYRADYFGEKLHVDQNEKLVMFGVTHICGIDGHSGKVVGNLVLPLKNNTLIYEDFYRYAFIKYTCMLNIILFSS